MGRARLLLLGVSLTITIACDSSDVGDECKGMDIPLPSGATTEGDVMRAQGSEIVEYNAEFPCNTTVCVATLGRGGYCSQECSKDSQCPDAFECRQVQDMGPLSERSFCAWAICQKDSDCGDEGDYKCSQVNELSLGEIVKLCDWRED